MRCGSLDHLEFCEGFLVYGEAEAGKIIVKIHETVLSFWFTVEDIPEKFVADFDVHDGEIFGHGQAVEALTLNRIMGGDDAEHHLRQQQSRDNEEVFGGRARCRDE